MAQGKDLGALIGQLGADIRQWDNAMQQVKRDLNQFEQQGKEASRSIRQQFDRVGSKLKSVGTKMSIGITAPLTALSGMALKTSADFEQIRQSMDVLNRSVDEGRRNFERLVKFGATTPFELRGLAKVQNQLQGFGLEADHAFESINVLGDIAAVASGNLEGIGLAFGRAAAKGKVTGRVINRFIGQGVPIIQLLADHVGVAQDKIFEMSKQGELSFGMLEKAMQKATEEGGLFFQGMKKQSDSLWGIWSNLIDNMDLAMVSLGDSIVETFDLKTVARQVEGWLQDLTAAFDNLSEGARKNIIRIGALLGAGGPIMIGLGSLLTFMASISWPIVLGVTAFSGAVGLIIGHWDELVDYFSEGDGAEIWSTVEDSIRQLKKTGTKLWREFGEDFKEISKTTFIASLKIISRAMDGILTVMKKFNGDFDTELNVFEDNIFETFNKIDGWIVGNWMRDLGIIVDGLKWLGGVAHTLFTKPFMEAMDLISDKEKEVVGVVKAGNKATEHASQVLQNMGQGYGIIATNAQQAAQAMANANEEAAKTGDKGGTPEAPETPTVPSKPSRDKIVWANIGESIRNTETLSEAFRELDEMINNVDVGDVGEKIEVAGQMGKETAKALTGMLTTLDSVFQKAVLHGRKLGNVLGKILKQLASKALINGLAMLVSPGGSFGLGKLLFGSVGNIIGANDALITSKGDVIKFHPDDDILASKDMGSVMGNSGVQKPVDTSNAVIENRLFIGGREVAVALEDEKYKRNR